MTIKTKMLETAAKKNRKVYRFKQLSTSHIVLYPLMILCWLYDQLKEKIRNRYKWNEKRASRIITNHIIMCGELNGEYIYYTRRRWNNYWTSHFWDKGFCHKYNHEISEYLQNGYQLVGYFKEFEHDNDFDYYTFHEITS